MHDGSYDISLAFFYFASPPVKMLEIDTAVSSLCLSVHTAVSQLIKHL